MSTEPARANTDSHGTQSGQWGLAALLLGFLLLLLFPIGLAVMIGLLIGAWEVSAVESRHIDFAILGGRVVVYSLVGLGCVAVIAGLMGLVASARFSQPVGLSLVGTLVAGVALAAMVVLTVAGHYIIEDIGRLRREHPRFRPASEAMRKQLDELAEKYPELKEDLKRAMEDGVLTEIEAGQIFRKAEHLMRTRPPQR